MDWYYLFDLAQQIGISEDEFLQMTPRQFNARRIGQNNRDRHNISLVRMASFLIAGASGNLKRGTTIQKFWPVPWEIETDPFANRDPAEFKEFQRKATELARRIESRRNAQ